ncbi:MAG: putative immunity protein [Solirubrobacteraceae bacterium]
MGSPQTLSETERRIVAVWAADCAERVLGLFEAEAPGDTRPRDAIERIRAFGRGELDVAEEIRRRFAGSAAAREVGSPAAAAAARAAGQAAAIPHMGAHALGAAAYTAKAVGLAAPERPEAVSQEIHWQLSSMSVEVRTALQQLPPVGENRSGPLGPGLLASGLLGRIIRDLQAGLLDAKHDLRGGGHQPTDGCAPGRTQVSRSSHCDGVLLATSGTPDQPGTALHSNFAGLCRHPASAPDSARGRFTPEPSGVAPRE